jgi:hypothetical protein
VSRTRFHSNNQMSEGDGDINLVGISMKKIYFGSCVV